MSTFNSYFNIYFVFIINMLLLDDKAIKSKRENFHVLNVVSRDERFYPKTEWPH